MSQKNLIDNSSQAEILFLTSFDKMGFDRKQLKEPTKLLYGFGGKRIELLMLLTCPNPTTSFLGGNS
jgi:hypothetical protein